MNELIKSVSPEIIGGLLALATAVIGAKIATKANKQETKAKELREAYADVFSGYYACMVEMSGEDVYKLVTAIERACLICSQKSETIMRDAIPTLAKEPLDISALGEQMLRLREEAKKDVRNAECK